MVAPSCERSYRGSNVIEAVPKIINPFIDRLVNLSAQLTQSRFIRELRYYDAAYLWPDSSSINTFKKIKKLDKPIFLERINCYTGKSKSILDDAYGKLGLQRPINENTVLEAIRREHQEIELSDWIFCPSPEVKKSFEEAGVPEKKLILTSYGWSPERFPNRERAKTEDSPLTILFVGFVCVRKGAHLLLGTCNLKKYHLN